MMSSFGFYLNLLKKRIIEVKNLLDFLCFYLNPLIMKEFEVNLMVESQTITVVFNGVVIG